MGSGAFRIAGMAPNPAR